MGSLFGVRGNPVSGVFSRCLITINRQNVFWFSTLIDEMISFAMSSKHLDKVVYSGQRRWLKGIEEAMIVLLTCVCQHSQGFATPDWRLWTLSTMPPNFQDFLSDIGHSFSHSWQRVVKITGSIVRDAKALQVSFFTSCELFSFHHKINWTRKGTLFVELDFFCKTSSETVLFKTKCAHDELKVSHYHTNVDRQT